MRAPWVTDMIKDQHSDPNEVGEVGGGENDVSPALIYQPINSNGLEKDEWKQSTHICNEAQNKGQNQAEVGGSS